MTDKMTPGKALRISIPGSHTFWPEWDVLSPEQRKILERRAVETLWLADAIRALLKKTEESKWIEWGGGACPIARNIKIDVKFRDNIEFTASAAGDFSWRHHNSDDDIVAYRIIPEVKL